MKLMKLEDLTEHDVYEFTYDYCIQNELNWQKSSIYVSFDDFCFLGKYINLVIKNYEYYGPQKVYIKEWNKIKSLVLKSENEHENTQDFLQFFEEIESWFKSDPQELDFFWIYGV